MRGLQLSNRRNAVGTHRQMNRAGGKRIADSSRTQCDVDHRGILNQHRDHDVPILTYIGNRCRRARARRHDVCDLCHRDIMNRQIVPAAEDSPGHALAHAAETDEAYVHVFSFISGQLPAHPFDFAAYVVDDVAGLQVIG
jgi:hypothetical protein